MTEVTPLAAGNYAELAAFLAAFPGETNDSHFWNRRFRLWWDDNPAFTEGLVRGAIVRDGDAIAGFLGSVPSLFWRDRIEQRVFGGTTWRVLPKFRSKSIPLYIAAIEAAPSSIHFNTTANAAAARSLEYMGFRAIASYPSERAFLIPVHEGRVVRAFLRERFHAVPDRLAGLPLAAAQWPLTRTLEHTPRDGVGVIDTVDRRIGEDIDALWQRARSALANTTVRTSALLRWFCHANPDFRKTLIAQRKGGELRGTAIFGDARWRGLKVLELADLWTDHADEDTIRALLAGAWDHARRAGYDMIVLHDYAPRHADLFKSFGVVFTLPADRKHYYRLPDGDERPLTFQNAFLTGLEGDLSL